MVTVAPGLDIAPKLGVAAVPHNVQAVSRLRVLGRGLGLNLLLDMIRGTNNFRRNRRSVGCKHR
jgi:hypothetical protein